MSYSLLVNGVKTSWTDRSGANGWYYLNGGNYIGEQELRKNGKTVIDAGLYENGEFYDDPKKWVETFLEIIIIEDELFF